MGCVVAVIGLALPRVALVLLWLGSDRLSTAIDSSAAIVLGFFLLPTTTLFWALAYSDPDGVQGFGLVLVAFGLLIDLTAHANGGRLARHRRR